MICLYYLRSLDVPAIRELFHLKSGAILTHLPDDHSEHGVFSKVRYYFARESPELSLLIVTYKIRLYHN